MADDEQFSLCWNNFNTNLSAGFHESLCRGDLVDVTLAAEGQLVKAHRLVLSVCSPYFRKMFTQMPANQHAFVFLKDVSHSALKDLIQFMYCGEVNVKQDALPAFISTAEALQIKGLTENGDGPSGQAPHPSPAKESTVVHSTPAPPPTGVSPRGGGGGHKIVQRARVQSYKIESEESSDEKAQTVHVQPTPVAQKRTMARTVTPASTPVLKRAKITTTADPLEASEPTVQTIQIVKNVPSSEPEYVEMPIETINPKSEPEYVEDSAVMEGTEQEHDETETHEIHETEEGQYVEDESYGDMKYDESYFTEGDDTKAGASGFGESYAEGADQSASEAQEDSNLLEAIPDISGLPDMQQHITGMWNALQMTTIPRENMNLSETQPREPGIWYDDVNIEFVGKKLQCMGYLYILEKKHIKTTNWVCNKSSNRMLKCPARLVTTPENLIKFGSKYHNHEAVVDGYNSKDNSFMDESQQTKQPTKQSKKPIRERARRFDPTDVWYDNVKLEYVENRLGSKSLRYGGYLYIMERKYSNSINWVCNKNSNIKLRCPGRCVTVGDDRIKFGKNDHNHEVVYDDDK